MALYPEDRKRLIVAAERMEQDGVDPASIQRVVDKFKSIYDPAARRDEGDFLDWYGERAQYFELDPDPDNPQHFYNYRAAFRAGAEPDETGHWPSKYKLEGHPNLIIDGIDTRTGEKPDWESFINAQPYFERTQETAIAPQRNEQITGKPTIPKEVPAENVRLEQMRLSQPEAEDQFANTPKKRPSVEEFAKLPPSEQFDVYGRAFKPIPGIMTETEKGERVPGIESKKPAEIMEPVKIQPSTYLSDLGGAFTGSFKKMGGALNLETARKLERPLRPVNPQWVAMGIKIMEAGGPKNKQEEFYVKQMERQIQQDDLQREAKPLADKLRQAGNGMLENIPEKDRSAVEAAQSYLTSSEAKKPSNLSKTIAATLIAGADQSANVAAGIAGAVPGLEGIPAITMMAQEKQSWIDAAKQAGLDNKEILDRYGDNYAIPSGALEYAGSAIVGLPARSLIRGKTGKIAKAASKVVPKSVVMSSILGAAKNLGATVGSAAFEGLTEMSQQELQNVVLYWALTDAAKNNPEKADAYIASRDAINLKPINRETLDSFIVGFAASLPQNIAARILGGAGKALRGKNNLQQTVEGEVSREDFIPNARPEISVPKTAEQKIVRKTGEVTTEYVPGEAGSIIPNKEKTAEFLPAQTKPTEGAQNVQQEEKGRVQIAPPEINRPKDGLLGANSFSDQEGNRLVDEEIKKTKNENVSVGMADFLNLTVLNERIGHPKADEIIKEIGRIIQKHTDPLNGENSRVYLSRTKGDEFVAKGWNVSKEDLDAALGKSRNEIDAYIKNLKIKDVKGKPIDLTAIAHPKHGYLPTGSGAIDYGVSSIQDAGSLTAAIERADLLAAEAKTSRIRTAAEKEVAKGKNYLYNKEENKYELEAAVLEPIIEEKLRTKEWTGDSRSELQAKARALIDKEGKYERIGSGIREVRETGSAPAVRTNQTGTGKEAVETAPTETATTQEVTPQQNPPETPEAPATEPVSKPKPPPAPPAQTENAKAPVSEQEAAIELTPTQELNAAVKIVLDEQNKALKKAEKKAVGKLPKKLRGKVRVINSKEPPQAAKNLVGKEGKWEAAVWYNPDNKVVEVHINENLPPEKYAEALYHEIPGHIGQRLVFADNPNILNTMRQMYSAAKSRNDVDIQGIRKAYKEDIAKAGERGDDLLFEEWTAHNLHRYLIENDRASIPTRIYNLFRGALIKIGVVKENIDDVLRSMVKKMRKAKDVGVIENAIKTSFMRPAEKSGDKIYDLESAKAVAQANGLEYVGSQPSSGGPEYLFKHKKSGTTFKAKTRGEVNRAIGDLADRIAPKGTVTAGQNIRFKRPIEEVPKEKETSPEDRSVSPGVVNLDINDETKGEMIRRVWTDRFHRLRRIMEMAEKQTGKPLPDELNAYVKQDIITSKIDSKIKGFNEDFVNPILDIAAKAGLNVKQVGDYLYAKHAEEADQVVGERRPDLIEQGKPPSGLSMERRKEIADWVKSSGKKAELEKISDIVQEWNKTRLNMMVDDQLITADQRDAFLNQYKYYVPLKGGLDEEGNVIEENRPRTGKGYSVGGREVHMRKGRYSEAQNILAQLASDTAEKAIRGEKNRVIRSLYEFSKKFENDLIVSEPLILKQVFNKKTGTFESKKLSNFEIGMTKRYGQPIDFKIDGKPMQLLVKDVPLQRALTNMGSEGTDAFAQAIRSIAQINKYLAMTRTQLSVNFIPSNALRDTMTAQLNALGLNLPKEQQKGLAFEILKSVPKAVGWAYQGQTGGKGEGADTYRDFVKNGGAIEFLGMKDVEAMQKSLERSMATMRPGALSKSKKLMRDAFEYVTILNSSVENANRLATYKALIGRGVSKQQAAYIAKNITVNFNRKGEMGSFLNAWALFANAGIQGSVRLLNAFKTNPKLMYSIASGITASSLGFAELMRMVSGDDPEDKENYYDKISDFTRDTHMVLPIGKLVGKDEKRYLRIPLPYGYNVFWAFGQHLSRVIHGGADKIPEESLHLLGAIADAFNPIGGSVDLADPKAIIRNFTPTILQPLAELAVNQNFMGGQVVKEPLKGFGPQPVASHLALKRTPEFLTALTSWANDITGGGKYRPGVVNVSPDVIKHLWEFGTGGTGKMLTDIVNLPYNWIANKEVAIKDIPLLQRFTGEVNEYKDVKTFYDNIEKAQRIYKDYQTYKVDDPEKAKELLRKYPAVISMLKKKEGITFDKNMKQRTGEYIPLNKFIVQPLKRYNDMMKRANERGDKNAVKRIEKEMINHAQKSNARLEKILKPMPKREKP
jgi:GGDEF domain-containing protein